MRSSNNGIAVRAGKKMFKSKIQWNQIVTLKSTFLQSVRDGNYSMLNVTISTEGHIQVGV